MSNLVKQSPKFSVAIQTDTYKKLINNTLQDAGRANRFIASVSSAVAVNSDLQNCDAGTVLAAALLGESLSLSPSPQLGQYYMIPYGGKAQFQIGYKGYIQLAIRSGYYKKLNVLSIKKGELIGFNPLEEDIEVNLIMDELERESAETIGYYAMFEYHNGFRKAIYWSREKMLAHADKYSFAFKKKDGKSFWDKDFDSMAYKTMLRQLISKWGIMSIEMQDVLSKDMSVINTDGTYEYVDNAPEVATMTEEENQPQEVKMSDL